MEPMQPPEPTLPPRSTPIESGAFADFGARPMPPPSPPGWGSPQFPYGGPMSPSTRTHGLATAALVCGLVGLLTFWVVGIVPLLGFIFGLISARTIKRSGGTLTGLGKARAGWILGLIGMVGAALLFWAIGTGRIGTDSEKAVTSAEVGDCVKSLPEEGVVFELDFSSCDEPHAAEVFLVGELDPDHSRRYPGDEAVLTEVETACADAFEPYVGREYNESVFAFFYLYPRSITWKVETSYVCFLSEVGKESVGSAFHSDR